MVSKQTHSVRSHVTDPRVEHNYRITSSEQEQRPNYIECGAPRALANRSAVLPFKSAVWAAVHKGFLSILGSKLYREPPWPWCTRCSRRIEYYPRLSRIYKHPAIALRSRLLTTSVMPFSVALTYAYLF